MHIKQRFQNIIPPVDFCSLRYITETSEKLSVRQKVVEPPLRTHDTGVMLTVIDKGGLGYAATSDLTETGLKKAMAKAQMWAEHSRNHMVIDLTKTNMSQAQGEYNSTVTEIWDSVSTNDKLDLLRQEAEQCKLNDKIVDWEVSLQAIQTEQIYLTNTGSEIQQNFQYIIPNIRVIANQGVETQRRTFGDFSNGQQGGLEMLDKLNFIGKGKVLATEALQLLAAPNCPNNRMDVMLAPDQMILQIHESIGHPLELDRILGDERNYAGTTFVSLDMFGNYQYGSELLNVTFDPTVTNQFASYNFDDEGLEAKKTYIIQNGILQTPLGGTISQTRANTAGVANSRASSWNRPPIDRMANLNVEPGTSSFENMLGSIERGILMRTNSSWSIDDSRNKFQFGCEWGQLIENGELTQVVKNPNYRGISATFWRNLSKVGDKNTVNVFGVPNCGKGEPNQIMRVGHASPTCVFADIDVFGGV
ncbi:TldD/PmbA family protein [Candidatus Halobeggiatoa sp. HSG11]|nr:TldD/PmbA family protein [Candidatus Halobeggiatoa sp. HSG11]